MSRGRVQVDCYAESYGAAKRLSRAVRAALDGYSGGGFQGVFHAGTRDSHDSEAPFRVSLDFITVFTS
ncbi:tail completion protein gp17 [Rhodobacter capsulatus]|uniref:tail completion protein gp17 n=1 Tax=Rhodobacter capsulatus TaxID=1061 RepID=UPI0040251413